PIRPSVTARAKTARSAPRARSMEGAPDKRSTACRLRTLKARLTLFLHHVHSMDTSQIPLFAMLRQRLGYLGERQRVIAQNVANTDTPGYAPRDLKAFTFSASLQSQVGSLTMQPSQTSAGHMPGNS